MFSALPNHLDEELDEATGIEVTSTCEATVFLGCTYKFANPGAYSVRHSHPVLPTDRHEVPTPRRCYLASVLSSQLPSIVCRRSCSVPRIFSMSSIRKTLIW